MTILGRHSVDFKRFLSTFAYEYKGYKNKRNLAEVCMTGSGRYCGEIV